MMLRRGTLSLRAATGFRRGLATSSSSPATSTTTTEKEKDDKSSGLLSSWVGKIKGAFQSKSPPATDPATPTTSAPTTPTAPATLIAFADELKKVTRVANLASLLKLRQDVNQQSHIKDLEKLPTIYRALGKHNPTGQNVVAQQKALAAEECSCTIQEVDKALAIFERMTMITSKMKQMQEKGEEIPKTVEQMSKMVYSTFSECKPPQSHSTGLGRNAPCNCGSGKKFKRCCGRGT